MTEKIRIMILAANPKKTTPLRLDEEIREIDEKIWKGTLRDAFTLVPVLAVRAIDLQDALLKHRPHIVHFSGHGNRSERIYLENNSGAARLLSKKALTELFNILKREIRIVTLNVCHSRDQAESLTRVIDFAIGMNGAIQDKTAIAFAGYYYQSLAFGCSVKEAFDLARNHLSLAGIRGANIPELLVRDGCDASKTFLIEKPLEEAQKPAELKSGIPSGQRNVIAGTINDGTIITGDSNSVNTNRQNK